VASINLKGDTSGDITISAPSVAGINTLTLPASTGNVVIDSATQTLTNKTIKYLYENATVSASAPSATTNYDVLTQSVQIYTSDATTDFTLNIRGDSGTTLSSILDTEKSVSIALMVTNGATPYYPDVIEIDGSTVTPKWQGGTAISSGNASSIDVYFFTIIKTAATPTYTVLASQTKFA